MSLVSGLAAAAVSLAAAPAPAEVIGRSVEGRPLRVVHVGSAGAPVRVLVVGCIHGTERAGLAVTRALRGAVPPDGVELLLLDELNPDGCAAGTRGNAHGVDLNRNLPTAWRKLTGTFASGPRPSSEPETRAVERLVLRERPAATVWFHQHMDLVGMPPGPGAALARRYALVTGMRARPLPRPPGSWTRWQRHRRPGDAAFVVELPAGRLSPAGIRRHRAAVLAVAAVLRPGRAARTARGGRR